MSQLRQEDIRVLEQSRQRLYQLSQSIGSLKTDVLRTSPMPAWDSLQLSASILAQNLKSITDHMKSNAELFEKIVTYPSTNFPGRTQEGLLGQLLRKKLEPGVERWVEEGRSVAASPGDGEVGESNLASLEETWQAARDFIGERVARAAVTHRRDVYTAEEREMGIENVNTGLAHPMKLGGVEEEDSESDEDEDEDAVMEDVEVVSDGAALASGLGVGDKKEAPGTEGKKASGPARNLDEIARFMIIGLGPEDEVLVGGIFFRR